MRYLVAAVTLWAMVALLAGCEGHKGSSKTTVTQAPQAGEAGKELPRVVIKKFTVRGIDEQEAAGISSSFCVEVAKSKNIELVCNEDIKNLFKMKEDQIKFGNCEESKCLAEMAAKVEADYIIAGSYDKVGDRLLFGVKLIKGEDGTVVTRLNKEVTSGDIEDLLDASAEVAAELIKQFN